jgi:precorrin-2 dehydrogenase/sirohydrochlorin ferrochelatase
MHLYLPIALNVKGWRCLVVGGGEVAARRIETLTESGAIVQIVAPQIVPSIRQLVDQGQIQHTPAAFDESQLQDVRLVVVATNSPEVNARVAAAARERGILVNDAEIPERGDFVVPSVLRRGDLTLTVNTGGSSPALTRRIKDQLAAQFGPEWSPYVALLGEMRERVLNEVSDASRRKQILAALASDDILLNLLREGRDEDARTRALSCISPSLD